MPKFTIQTTMQSPINILFRVLLGACLGSTSLMAMPLMSQAQTTAPTPLEDLQTKDSADFFNGRGNGQASSVMNFIQNAIIGTPRSSQEFAADQQENFNDATSQFRKQQAELLRRQQPTQAAPDTQVAPLPTGPSALPNSNP